MHFSFDVKEIRQTDGSLKFSVRCESKYVPVEIVLCKSRLDVDRLFLEKITEYTDGCMKMQEKINTGEIKPNHGTHANRIEDNV